MDVGMVINYDINSMYPMIRKQLPGLVAQQIVGHQPMAGKAGKIFSIDKTFIVGHSFNLKYWPYVKMVSYAQLFEAERWCYDNIKSRYWRSRGLHFAFKRKEDMALFLLTWGN